MRMKNFQEYIENFFQMVISRKKNIIFKAKKQKKKKHKNIFIPQKYINPYRKGNKKENKLLLIHNKAAKLDNKKIKNYGGKSYECN